MRAPTLAVLVGLLVGVVDVGTRYTDTHVRARLDAPRSFELADPAWQQQIGPLFGSAAAVSPSAWVLRGARVLVPGPRECRVNAAAAILMGIAAGLVTWLGWLLTRSRVVAAGVGLAMAAGPNIWPLATAAEATLRPLLDTVLVLGTLAAALRWREDGHRSAAGLAVGAGVLAMADNLALLAALAPALVLLRARRTAPVTRPVVPLPRPVVLTVAVSVLVAILCAWHVASSHLLWSAQPEFVRSAVPEPNGLELIRDSWQWPVLPHEGAGAVVAARLGDIAIRWLGDLRVLGTALAAIGLVGAFLTRPTETAAVVSGLSLMAIGGFVPGTAALNETWPMIAAGAWLFAGIGLARLREWGAGSGGVAAGLLSGLLPILSVGATLAAARSVQAPEASRSMDVKGNELAGSSVFVAGSPSVARVAELVWARPGVARIPLNRSIVEAAAPFGPLFTLADASQRLELLGARLGEVATGTTIATSSLHRLDPCASLGETWVDVTETAQSGRVGLHPVAGASLALYVARATPLRFRLAAFPGWPEPEMEVSAWDATDATELSRLDKAASVDGVNLSSRPSGADRVYRVTIRTGQGESTTLALALGGLPQWAVARARSRPGSAADHPGAQACAGPGGVDVGVLGRNRPELAIALDHRDAFAEGWHDVERAGRERFRWTSGLASEMLWRFDTPLDVEVTVVASPSAPSPMVQTIGLVVDGASFGEQRLTAPEQAHAWVVPASAWRVGVTSVMLTTSSTASPPPESGDRRQLGVRVSRIVVRRFGSTAP